MAGEALGGRCLFICQREQQGALHIQQQALHLPIEYGNFADNARLLMGSSDPVVDVVALR